MEPFGKKIFTGEETAVSYPKVQWENEKELVKAQFNCI